MSEYNEGDLVKAVKGELVISGRLDFKLEVELTLALRSDVRHLIANGYTVTVIEKAPPRNPLPTELGWYLDDYDQFWRVDGAGRMYLPYDEWAKPENFAPFTRLEPAHVTAKKVLDRVRRGVPLSPMYVFTGMTKIIDMVGVEFGVGGNE